MTAARIAPADAIPRQRNPRSIPNLLVQAAEDDVRSHRARVHKPELADLSAYGSADRQAWIANLDGHMKGGPALRPSLYATPPQPLYDEDHAESVASCQATPWGQFWRTGRRDPVPPSDPGEPPFSEPSHELGPSTINRVGYAERYVGGPEVYPGPLFYFHQDPTLAGRYKHRHQERTIIWNWRRDDTVFAGRGQMVGLTPDAYDAVQLSAADCEALSGAAILCHANLSADICPPSIRRPGNVRWPLLGTIQEQSACLDDFREGCLRHLGAAAILLRGVPEHTLRRALPPNWSYPSFPGGTFYDAIEAYGILDASFAGIVFDMGMPTLDHMPPLSLFAEWGIPYGWLVPHGYSNSTAWLVPEFSWQEAVFWDFKVLGDLVRAKEQEREEEEDERLRPFTKFAIIKDRSRAEFERRYKVSHSAASKCIDGLSLQWISRERVRDEFLLERMRYDAHWPNGTLLFRSWSDIKRVEDATAQRNNTDPEDDPTTFSYKIRHSANPTFDDEEDDLEDDHQVIMHKASALGVRRPDLTIRPVPRPWRIARPPPRELEVGNGNLWDWLRGLDNGAPKVSATLLRDVPPHKPQPTQSSVWSPRPTLSSARTTLPSAGLEAQSPRSASPEWIEVTRRKPRPPPQSQARPLKQTTPVSSSPRLRTPDIPTTEPDSSNTRTPWLERSPEPPSQVTRRKRQQGRASSPSHQQTAPHVGKSAKTARKERGRPRSRSVLPESSRPRQRRRADRSGSLQTVAPARIDKGKERAVGERPSDSALLEAALPQPSLGLNMTAEELQKTAMALLAAAERLRQDGQVEKTDVTSTPTTQVTSVAPPSLSIRGAAGRARTRAKATPNKTSLLSRVGVTLLDRMASTQGASSSTPSEEPPATPLDSDMDYTDWGPVIRRPIPSSTGCPSPEVEWPARAKLEPLGLDFRTCLRAISPDRPVTDNCWPEAVNRTMPSVLTRGRIRLRLGSWLRYILFHCDCPTDPPEEFLRYAISRGIAFDLGEIGEPGEQEAADMDIDLPESLTFDEWRGRVRRLLEKPRALQFLCDGGIAWRIALDLGDSGMLEDAIASVSIEAQRPLPDETGWPATFVVDRPSESDYSILIGRVQGNRSLMPHPDVWNALFPGEWCSAAEFWYRRRTETGATRRADSFRPRNFNEWRREVRDVAPVAMRAFMHTGDPRREAIFARLGHLSVDTYRDVDIEGEELASMSEG